MIDPIVMTQANGQNNRSKGLKWGIIHLCNSNNFGDTIRFMKIWVFQFLHFCKKWQNYYTKWRKLKILEKLYSISSKIFKLQKDTIPHFKALDQLFWLLAWVLTLGVIIFEIYQKVPAAFFMHHPQGTQEPIPTRHCKDCIPKTARK